MDFSLTLPASAEWVGPLGLGIVITCALIVVALTIWFAVDEGWTWVGSIFACVGTAFIGAALGAVIFLILIGVTGAGASIDHDVAEADLISAAEETYGVTLVQQTAERLLTPPEGDNQPSLSDARQEPAGEVIRIGSAEINLDDRSAVVQLAWDGAGWILAEDVDGSLVELEHAG